MCGLIGAVGSIGKDEKAALRMLLVVDSLRGPHSTGIAAVNGKNEVAVVKQEGGPHVLFDRKAFDKAMNQVNYCVIGHNRYATQGAINSRNAHPFEFDTVVGAHNGTLKGQWRLPDYREYEVDSENIYHSINKDGLDATLPILDGAYALSYWDKQTQELVLLRNKERPLYLARSRDKKTIFWASEEWMLSVSLSRNGIKFDTPTELPVGEVFRFKPDRVATNPKDVEVTKSEFTPFVSPPPKAWPQTGGSTTTGGKVSAPADKKKSAEMRKVQGQMIKAIFKREMVYKHTGSRFLEMEVDDYYHPELKDVLCRIYCEKHPKVWDAITKGSDLTFEVKVTGLVNPGSPDGYLLLNPTDAVEIVDIWEGEQEDLTDQEFYRRSRDGCVECGGFPLVKCKDEVRWYGEYIYECGACISQKKSA